jgi:hypothetical protein
LLESSFSGRDRKIRREEEELERTNKKNTSSGLMPNNEQVLSRY